MFHNQTSSSHFSLTSSREMRGDIMCTKWQSVSYALQKHCNEWFSRVVFTGFWRKQMHKPKQILNNFRLQDRLQPLKNSKNSNFGYNGYKVLIKYI